MNKPMRLLIDIVCVTALFIAVASGMHTIRCVSNGEYEHEHGHVHLTVSATRSGKWPALRNAYAKAHPECAACGSKDSIQVHHVKPFHIFPEEELSPDNLISLCGNPHGGCHFWIGHLKDFKAANPYVRDDAALFRQRIQHRVYNPSDWPKARN